MDNNPESADRSEEPTQMPPDLMQVQIPDLDSPELRSAIAIWRIGLVLTISSIPIAFSPAIIAAIMVNTCPGGWSGANEGNCGWAALPWFLIISVPFGILTFLAGLIVLIYGSSRKAKIRRQHQINQSI